MIHLLVYRWCSLSFILPAPHKSEPLHLNKKVYQMELQPAGFPTVITSQPGARRSSSGLPTETYTDVYRTSSRTWCLRCFFCTLCSILQLTDHSVQLPECWQCTAGSPRKCRNFCHALRPRRCRHGFKVCTYKIPCSDVIRCSKVTVIPFPGCKST